jgi:phospholipase C
MAELTRRRLLGSAAGALGGAAALSLLPPSVQKAVAAGPPKHGSLRDIEHVVMLMQENRSFDHYFGTLSFGTLSGVRGFADPHPKNAQRGSGGGVPRQGRDG